MVDVVNSIKHPAVVAARATTGQSRPGKPTSFLIEGGKLVLEAVEAGAPLEGVFFMHPLEETDTWQAVQQTGVPCWLVTRGVYHRILGLTYETSTRILGTVKTIRRSAAELVAGMDPSTHLLVGESIQDPRNVGTLVRTAEACGLRAAAFTEGSADPFSRPSLRSSTGSILRVSIATDCRTRELLEAMRATGSRLVGASAAAAAPCWEVDLSPPCAFLLGNETTGLSREARELSDVMVRIPMYGRAHSFNVTVAAGILLYEAARQREARR
jgi:TrmH family RNA methyltransferase